MNKNINSMHYKRLERKHKLWNQNKTNE